MAPSASVELSGRPYLSYVIAVGWVHTALPEPSYSRIAWFAVASPALDGSIVPSVVEP